MKKVLSKFKKYSFWIAFTGVVVIFIKNIAELFGFEIDTGAIENVIMSLCGVLVVLGLVIKEDESVKTEESNHLESDNIDANDNCETSTPSEKTNNDDSSIEK